MALDYELLRETYPFCRLTGPANVLIMPGLHSAHISSRLMQQLGGVTVIGPVIDGLAKPVQIVQMGATVMDRRDPPRSSRVSMDNSTSSPTPAQRCHRQHSTNSPHPGPLPGPTIPLFCPQTRLTTPLGHRHTADQQVVNQ